MLRMIKNISLFSASTKDKVKKDANGWDSLDEQISAAEEKKHGIKNLIKRRLRSRPSTIRSAKKDGGSDPTPNSTLEKKSQSGHPNKPSTNGTHSLPRKTEVKQKPKAFFIMQSNSAFWAFFVNIMCVICSIYSFYVASEKPALHS